MHARLLHFAFSYFHVNSSWTCVFRSQKDSGVSRTKVFPRILSGDGVTILQPGRG